MKILCIADKIDPLIYSDRIKSRFGDIGMILAAGDLNLDYYGFIVTNLNKPLLFVFGNHNLKELGQFKKEYGDIQSPLFPVRRKSYGSLFTGGKVRREKGVIIAGAGGCMKYNKGPNQYSEAGMFFTLLKLVPVLIWNKIFHGRYLDILLTHAPPYGIQDGKDRCHTGFKSFLLFNRLFKPLYHIHGHIHLYDLNTNRKTVYKDTTVMNAYNHVVIEV